MLQRVQHVAARKNRRDGVSVSATEHYLRDDLACGVRQCTTCAPAAVTSFLTVTEPLCIVEGELLLRHLDWVRTAALTNVVVPETAMVWLDAEHPHMARQVLDLMSSSPATFYIWSNHHHCEAFSTRLARETPAQWQARAAVISLEWYRDHLKGQDVKVVLVDEEWASRSSPAARLCFGWYEPDQDEAALFAPHIVANTDGVLYREARLYRSEDDCNVAEAVVVSTHEQVHVTHVNRALTGDRVILDANNRVVAISRRATRVLIGSVDCDARIFRALSGGGEVPVLLRDAPVALLQGKRVAVSVDCWPIHRPHPLGHVVRILGDLDDPRAEQEATLLAAGVRTHDFSTEQRAQLPGPSYVPELDKRMDLRHLPICSVDPPGCTDIDDALHCVQLGPDRFQVGVHIADVSHYVAEGSALDKEARERSTTVYLVDRRVDMLPERLSGEICSLMSNVDRHAMSVIWTLDGEARIVDVRFCKSLIRSRASLTYARAQGIIEDPTQTHDLAVSLRGLATLSQKLRARRFAMGALELSSPVVTFVHRDNGGQDLLDVQMYTSLASNSMVEEWMLLANICVAYEIAQHYPAQALLRRHAAPDPLRWETLRQNLAAIGVPLGPAQDSRAVSAALAQAPVSARTLVTRYMQQAQYVCSSAVPEGDYWHYGLACPIYTHFTSPIRRYADICVHRLLSAAIGWTAAPPRMDARLTEQTARHINHRHRMAQIAGRASAQLHSRRVLLLQGPRTCDADVLAISDSSWLRCVVPELGIEVQVDATSLNGTTSMPKLLQTVQLTVCALAGKDGFEARLAKKKK